MKTEGDTEEAETDTEWFEKRKQRLEPKGPGERFRYSASPDVGELSRVEQYNRERLKDVYNFDVDEPPEDYHRFRKDVAINQLTQSIWKQEVREEVRIEAIEILATYGPMAEPALSAIARGDDKFGDDVVDKALEELREIRDEEDATPGVLEWLTGVLRGDDE